jgi:CheY-like chemotaxis protein
MASTPPHSRKVAASSTPAASSARGSNAKPRAQSTILIIDADQTRANNLRQTLRDDGYLEPLTAASGDEALDVLGAHAQQFDLVIAWVPLIDEGRIDFFQILRKLGSPVRIACATPLTCDRYPNPTKLAGATAVLHAPKLAGLAAQADILIQNGSTVGHIVSTRHVPRLIPDAWAMAIYRTKPGTQISVPLT